MNLTGKYHFNSHIRNFMSHITYYSLMFSIAYSFKGQVHVFAGQVKIVIHSSCRTRAILKYFCPLDKVSYWDQLMSIILHHPQFALTTTIPLGQFIKLHSTVPEMTLFKDC